jgi:hypothetical protein
LRDDSSLLNDELSFVVNGSLFFFLVAALFTIFLPESVNKFFCFIDTCGLLLPVIDTCGLVLPVFSFCDDGFVLGELGILLGEVVNDLGDALGDWKDLGE